MAQILINIWIRNTVSAIYFTGNAKNVFETCPNSLIKQILLHSSFALHIAFTNGMTYRTISHHSVQQSKLSPQGDVYDQIALLYEAEGITLLSNQRTADQHIT